ncbi:hypothetical protein [Streptomyces sp. NPDC004135]
MSNFDPASGYPPYDQPPTGGHSTDRQATARRTALVICTVADVAAGHVSRV